MFAEAALVCLVIEHFVRATLGAAATNSDTLRKLLQKAVKKGLIRLPWPEQDDGIRRVCSVRDTLLHGNYAQAAHLAGCASVRDYFRNQFASEIATMELVADSIMKQIDPATGKPYPS